MRLSAFLVSTTAMLIATSAAIAADAPYRKAASPPTWTGFYFGGQVGALASGMDVGPFSYDDNYDFGHGGGTQVSTGIHAGYDVQLNNIVAGIEVDANLNSGHGFFAPISARIDSPFDASIRARAGFLVTPSALLYGTAGLAFGDFRTSASSSPNWNGLSQDIGSPDMLGGSRIGWTAGAGLEYALDANWHSRIAYLYSDFGTKDVNFSGGIFSGSASTRLTDSRVQLGLSYYFDGDRNAGDEASSVPAFDWSGFYLGGHVGTAAAQVAVSGNNVGDSRGPYTAMGDFTETLAGVHAGYNFEVGQGFVVGIEGDLNKKAGGGTLDLYATKSRPQSDFDGSIRARLGVAVTPQMLVYGTAGFAFGHFTSPFHETDSLNTFEVLGGTRTGWTAGGGAEYALDGNWSMALEARYTDWGTIDIADWDGEAATSKLSDVRVTSGLTYKFGPKSEFSDRDAVPANWNGLYAGAQVGSSSASAVRDGEFEDFTLLHAGLLVGYNVALTPSILLGVEGEYNRKFGVGFKIDDVQAPTSDWDGAIKARLGVMPTARSLIYVTGGYAAGNFNSRSSGADPCSVFPQDCLADHLGGFRQGLTYGVGAEYAFENNWSTRIEYRKTDWGTKDTVADFVGEGVDAKLDDQRINVGLIYRIGGDGSN